MKAIGFDFGTTNSTICFLTEAHGFEMIESFKPAINASDYIPSIVAYVAYEKNDKGGPRNILIGSSAVDKLTASRFESYENFKLLLGRDFDKAIDEGNGKNKTPIQVTQDYIEKLLELYKSRCNIGELERIVMTVPDAWFRGEEKGVLRESIENIYRGLEIDGFGVQLESEPISAAIYFCYAYEHNIDAQHRAINPDDKKYDGSILVIDYGGGTLDVALCKVEENAENEYAVRVLERKGFGEYGETNGCAGVAFDEAVVERLIRNNGLTVSTNKNDRQFIRMRRAFEKNKINYSELIAKMMVAYYDDHDAVAGRELFSFEYGSDGNEVEVFCEDLAVCFEQVCAPRLKDSLRDVVASFGNHGIERQDRKKFKILLVGGFSNFISVEIEVKKFFGCEAMDADDRFRQPFQMMDRSLAISKGAALLANKEKGVIIETCSHNYGFFMITKKEDDKWEEICVPLIQKYTDVKETTNPIYSDRFVRIKNKSGTLTLYKDAVQHDDSGVERITLSIDKLMKNFDSKYDEYQIGLSVNRFSFEKVYIRDKSGTEASLPLKELII